MKQLKLLILMLAAMLALPVHAQSIDDSEAADADSEAESEIGRPEMPSLFFRGEQRRVLEAVRQGVVAHNDFVIEEFTPVLLEDPVVSADGVNEVPGRRNREYLFDAYIVNHKTGKTTFWLNRQKLDLEEDAGALEREGLTGEEEGESLEIEDGTLSGGDIFNKSHFRIKVGQIIGASGSVQETLPVIRINKR